MSNVTIISDGTATGTKVKIGDEFMTSITSIKIESISVDNPIVRATLIVDVVALHMAITDANIECTDVVMADRIRTALLSVK